MQSIESFYDEEKKIWIGPERTQLFNPDVSIGRIFFEFLRQNPNNVLQISDSEGTTLTNRDVLTAAKRIAQHFKKMGLTYKDVIGIVGHNTTHVLPLSVACLFNCTPFHGVNPAHDEKSFRHMFGITKPKVIFCDGQYYDKIRAATHSFQPIFYTLSEHLDGVPSVLDLLEPTEAELKYRPETLTLGGKQTIGIFCSSGTTGLPKAICTSNEMAVHYSFGIELLTNEDFVFCNSGIDWFTGLFVLIIVCVRGCTRIITNKPFSADNYISIIQKYNISYTILSPRHVAAVLKCPKATVENFSSLRYIILGGGFIESATMYVLKTLAKNAIICFGYGSTETGGIAANFDMNKMPSVGMLSKGYRVRIVDDLGQNLGPNEIGEICVNNGLAWLGYYNNPQATKEARDMDGWIHTGDIGYFDGNHYLFIVDRKKDILKYNGFRFWSSEIEACLMEIPEVEEACVVCIYDESCGDKAGALVVKTKSSDLSREEIEQYVAKTLVLEHKHLHAGVLFVDSLPQNFNGKTDKKRAKALLLAALERGELS